jgi:hypothetical protein
VRRRKRAALLLLGSAALALPLHAQSPTATPGLKLLPFEERLRAAKSVKVLTSILGLELGASIEAAHAKLDKLSEPDKPPKEEDEEGERERGERKVLWQLGSTDYSAVFIKTNDENRIWSITAIVREGKEMPFEKIGDVAKAPIQSPTTVAWDVIRANRPLFRVVAEGVDGKAKTISLFEVKRLDRGRDVRPPVKRPQK